jgi:OmpA-OmpF porin, OOP family
MRRIIYSFFLVMLFTGNIMAQKFEIKPVDFNTDGDDFSTNFTNNGRFLYFTGDDGDGQKILMTERTSGGWASPFQLKDEVNDGDEIGAVAVTPDGQFMIFAAYNHNIPSLGRTDLYSARKVFGVWSDIQNLGPNVNSEFWDSQPTLTSDGKQLFFASDRPNGQGGVDIYVCTRTRDGWSRATNLGSTINTSYDEISPVIAADNKSMTFASNRSEGVGGFDVYFTKYSGMSFSKPMNAGQPINSSADEYFYTSLQNTNIAYFSSDRAGGQGGIDIYMAVPNPFQSEAVTIVSGNVYDEQNKNPLGAKIVVTDLKSGSRVADLRSDDQTGAYSVVLQPGGVYSITASANGYVFYSDRFEVPPSAKGTEDTKDIYLSPNGTRLLLFFDFDKTDLQNESIPELERIIEYLKDNPRVKISLEGHTDDVGSDDYNDKLSLDRANAVKGYIVNGGIESSRISTKGFGKRKPLMNDTSTEARSRNRRVEMRVII